MSLSSPIFKSGFAPVLVRISLGMFLFLAGWKKFQEPELFIEVVKSFHVMPDKAAVLYGTLLPYAEMLSGTLLFFGALTTFAAGLSTVLLFSVVYAYGVFPEGHGVFNKDIVLLAASLSLLASGAGSFSVDSFRNSSGSN